MTDRSPLCINDMTQTFGIILGTERYDECVSFYRDILGLQVWYDKGHLLCLRYGAGYLMIETGGVAHDTRKPNSANPTMLRFNVSDVPAAAALLESKGVSVTVKTYDWGVVGTFTDPDGNACELKDADDPFFAQ